MKFSAKARYGLRAVYVLGENYLSQNNPADVSHGFSDILPISSSRLAAVTGVSEPYLEKIMAILKKCGVVSSSMGAAGGYVLNHHPAQITIGRVLKVLEGPVFVSECSGCDSNCPNKDIFSQIYHKIDNVLEELTLADVLVSEK